MPWSIFSAGHLSEHISGHPAHQQYYSYKLKRLVSIWFAFYICFKFVCTFVSLMGNGTEKHKHGVPLAIPQSWEVWEILEIKN